MTNVDAEQLRFEQDLDLARQRNRTRRNIKLVAVQTPSGNLGLGFFRDSWSTLEKAIKYLRWYAMLREQRDKRA